MILTNSHIGGDVSLQPWSQKVYEAMGFDTNTLTQDWEVMGIGSFGIEAHNIIPLVWYGDSYSWAKYGHHILHSSFSQETTMGHEQGFCNCLLSFLCTNLDGLLGFQLNPDLTAQLRDCVNQQIPTNTLKSDRPQVFTRFMQGNNSMHDINNNEFFTKLHLIVIEATVSPFSALTNLFHQRFSKHKYLESTLELLQQFYILMEYHITKFNVFPGDLNQFCLRCARCGRRVSTIADIGATLKNAPTAMLMHWWFIHSHGANADDNSDGSKTDVLYSSLPLLFSTQETYDKSLSLFEHSDQVQVQNKFYSI